MSSTTILEVFIDESVVRVEIEVGMTDLPAFINLLPDGVYERLNLPPVSREERLYRFFMQDLILTADGTPLIGRLKNVEPRDRIVRDEISGEPLAVPDEDIEQVVFFVLEYPFKGEPESLAFKVPDQQAPGAQASIGFVLYHLGVATNDFRYLMTGATIDLDWEDPWHSRFRLRQLRRAYDAPMNVFLYVEPYEVRVEIIVRPLDIEQWIDLGLTDRGTIKPEMYGSVQGRVADFLAEHLNLTIDGEATGPVLDRINFLRRTLRSSTVIDPPEELSLFTAQLGVIFIVPRNGLPEEADVTWDLFSEKIPAVPGAATDEAGPMPSILTPDDNVLRWQNFLLNPTIPTMVGVEAPPRPYTRLLSAAGWLGIVTVVLLALWTGLRFVRTRSLPLLQTIVAAVLALMTGLSLYGSRTARVDDTRSGEIVGALLHNVYRSFDYRQEGAIYDALARSMTGDLLTQAYLETQRSLELRNQGGARVKVNEVDIVACRPEPLRDGVGFTADCRWNVAGSVGHWGHIHQRRNQYNALITVRAIDGAWKITVLELLSEERL
ncbi:MAG: hypothetical protein V3T53_02880 [Phycisphaerales bacterium]